jgi:hypothetical protein
MTFIVDGTNGLTFPNSTVQASAGNVLQVVQGSLSTSTSTSSTSFVDTGLSATITPKFSTSKILVIVNLNGCLTINGSSSLQSTLVRTSTSICNFSDAGLNGGTNRNDFGDCAVTYLDSPATTSATTYKVQAKSSGGATVYWCNQTNLALSFITLMEIAA